jgi:hypothetical protein
MLKARLKKSPCSHAIAGLSIKLAIAIKQGYHGIEVGQHRLTDGD